MKDSLPSWIASEQASAVNNLKRMFQNLHQSLCLDDSDLWLRFARSSQCERDIPSQLLQKLSWFQQVIAVQALRPDRLQSAMELFASRCLSVKELSPEILNLRRLYEMESLPQEPILVIISAGSDPSQELQELAEEVVGLDRYHQVAMGQGQSTLAVQLLRDCSRDGHWLCLKNLHLVTAWLPVLEKELNTLEPNENFRLWMTAEVHVKFPTMLLQSSLKVTYEAPPGIRRNLARTYDSWSEEFISKSGSITRAQALFVLAWFHAIVQERRCYIPQGWTKFYEFSFADLRVAADVIDRMCTRLDSHSLQWEFIHGLFENAIYGGRIDNSFDLQVLRSYLIQFFSSDVIDSRVRSRPVKLGSSISLPTSYHYKDYVALIESLPDTDTPSFFGLPANIERSAQRVASSRVIQQLKVLMRADVTGDKFDRETWVKQLGPILDMWKKLNKGTEPVRKKYGQTSDQEFPVTVFLKQEHSSALKLVQAVRSSLDALDNVIHGSALLTTEVQNLARDLLQHQVPLVWSSLWEGPRDPVQYLRSLVAKTLALSSWVEKALSDTLLTGGAIDLSELFHPDTFLNALRQQAARSLKCSMDDLKPIAKWNSTQISGAPWIAQLEGLQLEGCNFDGSRLLENELKSPTVSTLPNCTFAWVSQDTPEPYTSSDCILLPIYFSSDRERIVTRLKIPCGGNQGKWIQCGAALFLKS